MSTVHPIHFDRDVTVSRELSRSAAERYQVLQAVSERRAFERTSPSVWPQLKIIRVRLGRVF